MKRPKLKRAPRGEGLAFIQATVADPPIDGCVVWPFGRYQNGYGQILFNGEKRQAHSVALELDTGIRPKGMDACHAPVICHDRACINPLHLRWATRAENLADRALDGTQIQGERHGNAKLSRADVLAIRSDPRPQVAIAADYGVGQPCISVILSRGSWTHI